MKFARLRIVGFKTFVDPTDVPIEDGLTGIVGPNGCGKSNLVEALRWAMGEASYKAMRASAMDDVIFSGSGKRAARNFAEVSVTLDNTARTAPAAFNEIDILEVSRKIARDDGSTYRVNGREVRARDVQLLFADASSGSRSPSLVRQGQIGELIAAKPVERRALLEEAAGISGLNARRNEAEIRLRAAETNMERLDDHVGQLESQLEVLQRQARQAVRYKKLAAELRKLEAALSLVRWQEAEAHLREADIAFSDADALTRKAAGDELMAQAASDGEGAKVEPAREAAAAAAATVMRLVRERDGIAAEMKRLGERLEDLSRQKARVAEDRKREERLAEDTAAALRAALENASRLGEERAALDAGQDARGVALADARQHLKEAEAASRAARDSVSEARARRASEEAALGAARRRMEMAERAHADHARLLADFEREKTSLPDRAAISTRLEEALSAMTAADLRLTEMETATSDLRRLRDTARLAREREEKVLQALETERRTLAQLFEAPRKGGAPLLNEVRADPGFETALGAAFGEDLDASADEAAERHFRAMGGSAMPPLPQGASPLSEHVAVPAVLGLALCGIGIVGKGDGARLQADLRPGQMLVSRDGDVWRWDGYCQKAGATTPAARRLKERNRLTLLDARITEARALFTCAKGEEDTASTAVRDADAALIAARDGLRSARGEQDRARAAADEAARLHARIEARASAIEARGAELASERDAALTALQQLDAELGSAPDFTPLMSALLAAEENERAARASESEARSAVDSAARLRTQIDTRAKALEEDRARWQRRDQESAGQIARLDERRAALEAEIAAMSGEPARLQGERERLAVLIEQAGLTQSQKADALAGIETAARLAARVANEARDSHAKAREALVRAEERRNAALRRREELQLRIREEFEVRPAGLARIADLQEDAALPDGSDLEKRIDRLRLERDRFGGVNLLAEQEVAEATEKRDTMIREREDVIAAVAKLRAAIQALNREGRERLRAAFEDVNSRFTELFTTLFGGGTASLAFVDSDDPLEAGLDIIAHPPGKKPQTITLLSGGEQALTAIALIFAVFLTNPAPVCVLDEVDAPLDDANVERFCALLEDMRARAETRFLVITHNPITMSRMDRLFGVTMAERGVSQLVSVDLKAAAALSELG